MKGAIWTPSSSTLLPIPTILPVSNIKHQSINEKKGLVITESAEVWEISLPDLSVRRVPIEVHIDHVFCTDNVTMLIGEGSVYMYGEDILNTGILGTGALKLDIPSRVPIDSCIVTGSLYNHAAVIDSLGRLFTWGCGDNGETGRSITADKSVRLVNNSNLFRAKEVVCGNKFTGVLTDGCYVYVYGSMGDGNKINRRSLKNKNIPTSHPELERMTAIKIAAAVDYLCILVETGEVYAYDNCMDLVKLPVPQGVNIQQIACGKDIVYGLGDGEIVEWVQGHRKSESNSCILTTLTGRYYKIEKPYSQKTEIFPSCGRLYSMTFLCGKTIGAMPLGIKAYLINPYKRSQYASKLIDNAFESISPSASPKNSKKISLDSENFSDLSRLYSIGNNENTIMKIIQYRKEHELTKVIHKVLNPILYDLLLTGFKYIKDQAIMKKYYEKTLSAALMQAPLEKFLHKKKIAYTVSAFGAIKSYARAVYDLIVSQNKKKYKIIQEKEEKVREIVRILNEIFYHKLFQAFSNIKELEILKLQKQTAVLSFGQVISSKLFQIKKKTLYSLHFYTSKLSKLPKTLLSLHTKTVYESFRLIKNSSKHKYRRLATISRTLKDFLKKYSIQDQKKCFKKWKKLIDIENTLFIKRMYCNQIGIKGIILVLTYAYSRKMKSAYDSVKNYTVSCKYKLHAKTLIACMQKLVKNHKSCVFQTIRRLFSAYKSLKIVFKVLKKSRKHQLRYIFKHIELYTISHYKNKVLSFYIIFQHSIERIKLKLLYNTWVLLNRNPNKIDPEVVRPNYSFYSPKIKKESSGTLRNKACSVDYIVQNDSQQPMFMFRNDSKKLKKLKYVTQSLSILNPAENAMSYNLSPKETLSTVKDPTLSFKQSLIQKKVLEAANKIKNTKKKDSKPPLKPPWKPASTSTISINRKSLINSTIRRSQYDIHLKERGKVHSKASSADVSNCTSTPTLTSRNSSKQKIAAKNPKKSATSRLNIEKSLSSNIKFAFIVLENVINSVMNKRLFESLSRIKFAQTFSPKLPAPNPLDSRLNKPSWQTNLYTIGFEKLKLMAKCAIGREIIYRISA
jgi:Regulator of chromosome condensation (RCC1) repeat